MPEKSKYDVVIAGAGFAGSTAALVAARAGLSVALLESSQFMGSKIVLGSLMISTVIKRLIPDLEEKAPLERFIRTRRYSCLTADSALSLDLENEKYNQPPHNNLWTISRKKFDPWYALQSVEEGAVLYKGTLGHELIFNNGKVVGVRTPKGREIFGNMVIIAAGGNSRLVRQMGDQPEYPPDSYLLGIKEVIGLPPEEIESRFRLRGREGAAMNFFGQPIEGNVGSGYLNTNYNSVSIGAVINARSLKGKVRNAPLRYLMQLKAHPCIRRYIEGGKTLAMSTYIMPEIGFDYLRNLVGDGVMVTGDSAGFMNANTYSVGTLVATVSGLYAGETAVEAAKKGVYSARALSGYTDKVISSFVMDDMKKFNRTPYFSNNYPDFFRIYPELIVNIAEDYLANDEESPRRRQLHIFKTLKEELTLFPFLREIFESKRRFGGQL